ncbi:MAG: sigma-70 family RNA polymerase sigma factor [Caulobacterales bacterium]|nr:sigma-70 family RNA polymerase sigma factor [Caulobacterales bacterium]
MTAQDAALSFDPLRPRLTRIAYRMLGSLADAEDVVQEAFLRWLATDRATVQEPGAYLARTVTRLCLDVLKSARRKREVYVGPWLPEPVVDAEQDADALADDITLPLMLALDRLSPLERAAFLLHDVFGVAFEEIAETLGREPAACRQLASRARTHVRAARPRFPTPPERGMQIAEAFFAASRTGDMSSLQSLLAEDVAIYADGGGLRSAFYRTLVGVAEVMTVHTALYERVFLRLGGSELVRYGLINGLPGFISREPDGLLQTTAFLIEDGRVAAIYVMRNPEKLTRLEAGAQPSE